MGAIEKPMENYMRMQRARQRDNIDSRDKKSQLKINYAGIRPPLKYNLVVF